MARESENTELQERFAHAFVVEAPGNAAKAARLAGYAQASARVTGSRLLDNPRVQVTIRAIQFRELNGKLASKALGVLEAILDDPQAPPGVRVDAARTVLDRAGLVLAEQPGKQQGGELGAASLGPLLAKLAQAQVLSNARRPPALEGTTGGRDPEPASGA